MTSDAFTLDTPDDEGEQPGMFLRISRDATADDMATFLPDKTPAERAAWLDELRGTERATVTMSVVTEIPAETLHAFGQKVPVREITGLIIGPPGSEQFLRKPAELGPEPDGLRLTRSGEQIEVRLADGTITADIPLSCTFTVEAEGPAGYELTGYVYGKWVHWRLFLTPGEPFTLKFGDTPPPERNIDMVVLAEASE